MDNIVFVDSEINGRKQITDLGAIRNDGAEFHKNGPNYFEEFVKNCDFVVGHNIVHHDLLYIGKYLPKKCEIIDTLYLSPLLFPNRPYHKLLKDDKIENDDVNNPLSDSKKCKDLYFDEVAKYNTLPQKLKDIYGELLFRFPEFSGFFKSVSWKHQFFANVKGLIREQFEGQICTHANLDKIIKETPIELAYALALISAEDKKSITPAWVLHTFPKIQKVMNDLRHVYCHDDKCPYCNATFQAKKKLKEFFGYSEFRTFEGENLQERAVELALERKSLLAIFPTGGGKSLTFQLPALIEGEAVRGLTVVISPLQSLMKDQVDNLEKKNIVGAVTINGMLNPIERAESLEQVRNGNASLLYIAPESLRSKTIENLLLTREISRIVIDEAHCFSSWGQDFRVDYLFIADFIKSLKEKKGLEKDIPISCFTATAKPKVVSDICAYFRDRLGIELAVLASSATRTNLQYKVLYQEDESEKYVTLRELLIAKNCPTIVYVARVFETITLADRLTKDGIPALPYNGQMERSEKIVNQNSFMNNEVQVIVATSAFGMGVDKSDVKLVVHYDISDSLENYIQEAGRAGRDQSIQAECYILFNENDLDKHFLLLNQTKITINEIQQVWRAVKSMTTKTRKTVSASGLEIARHAGWDENIADVETRVRAALSALEQAGYLKRKMNSPRVFATGILVKSFMEAAAKIDKSELFYDENERIYAKRIIKSIISARATSRVNNSDEDPESRVDYLSDILGIPRMDVEEAISKMRQEKILADSMDLNAYIKKSEESKTTKIVARFAKLERYMTEHIFNYEGQFDLKEFNDKAIKDGIKDATVKNIKTILYYWSLREFIKCKRDGNIYQIVPTVPVSTIKKKVEKKLDLSARIANHLFKLATKPNVDEELVEFSLLSLTEMLRGELSLLESDSVFTEKEVEDALLYLSKIEAINLEGGFIVLYNSLNLERTILDNHIQYKQENYKELFNYYKMKTQQIHIVGEFANMMLTNYDDSMAFIFDYFTMDYDIFLKKYFKGRQRSGEILRNITPEKYKKLFGDLSDIQKQIIDDDQSQYISVIAGPGSGKTRVLVHKLAALLLLEDIKSEQLLMLTFSRMAAREFKSRLAQLVGSVVNYVNIKTFHSYCFDLLGKIGNEEEFDDVVRTAVDMINNGEVEEEKIAKAVLVIDEAQDIDKDEYALIQALIDKNPEIKIIAVGDDDQNIFEFRGSDSKYLESFVTDYGATKYEMVENYRSKQIPVALANLYAKTIKQRIKTQNIVSMTNEMGNVFITKYDCQDLEIPVCNDFFSKKLEGTTAILTVTNESALKIVGILVKHGIDARLIQSDDNIDLYNLVEFRYFIKQISKCDSPVVDDETWTQAKEDLQQHYLGSSIIGKVMTVIEAFESENTRKYRNDFIAYIRESSFADFESFSGSQVVVSTIHKSKGREFDNVFMLLDSRYHSSDEQKRKVYVGMTRAKTNLFIHIFNNGLERIARKLNIPYKTDTNNYLEPVNMEIQLGYHDVFLGYFKGRKDQILSLRCGSLLGNKDDYLTVGDKKILRYSMGFSTNTLQPVLLNGYSIVKSEIRYIVAWKDKDHPESEEIAIILPNLYLKKITENGAAEDSQIVVPDTLVEIKEEPAKEVKRIAKKTEVVEEYESNIQKDLVELDNEEIKLIKNTPLFKELKEYRLKTSKEQGVVPYVVLYDRTIIDIVLKKPTTKESLIKCHGMGERKYLKYGEAILSIVQKHL